MAFLSVITRHRPERANMLELNKASVWMQSDPDIQHIISVDNHSDKCWRRAHQMLVDAAAEIEGEYALILDDDDVLINARAVEMLKQSAASDPAVVIWRAWHGELGILPDDAHWGKRPELGHIGACGFVLRADVYRDVLLGMEDEGYEGRYANDYDIVSRAYDCGRVAWIDSLMTWAMQRGGV